VHDRGCDTERREPVIERNGAEYLISYNGSVFLALSFAAAESIARRMTGGRSAPAPAGVPHADAPALQRCA
jgi:hypothetical protein